MFKAQIQITEFEATIVIFKTRKNYFLTHAFASQLQDTHILLRCKWPETDDRFAEQLSSQFKGGGKCAHTLESIL